MGFSIERENMKVESLIVLVGCVLSLNACVEVRDKDDENKPAPAMHVAASGLVIDEDMYVYDGKILDADDLEKEMKLNEFQKKSVSSDVELSIEDLTITENGKLYTQGQNVFLHVQNLKSSKGQIFTFPENETAKDGHNGRSGGHLLLDLKSAQGVLKIQMRGENGGRGLDAPPPDEKLRGRRGVDITVELFNGICSGGPISADCGQGGKGLKGYPGGSGGDGGNAGTLEIRLEDKSEFINMVDRIPGHGAPGGSGGLGGGGGYHGVIDMRPILEINMEWYHTEKFNNVNRNGPTGNAGDPGVDGKDGIVQNICINKNGTTLCY